MVTSISLGNFSQQNGRTIITGSSSGGIDTEGLINALSDARRLPAIQLEERIELNGQESSAYARLQTLLSQFQTSSDFLRNPPGVNNEDENIFEYRGTTIGSNTSGAASNYISVSAEPGSDIASYDIEIDSLATFNTKITDTFALADADTDAVGAGLPFSVGTLSLGAPAIGVDIEADDTLNSIVTKINSVSDQSFVRASIIRVDDGQFRLALRTTQTGAEFNYELTPVHLQVGNEIAIEGEDFQSTTDRGGRGYSVVADAAASGGSYVEAGPDTGAFITSNIETTAPQADYEVRFDEAGTYYVWVSGRGGADDDTVHIGLDGVVQPNSGDVFGFNAGSFSFSNLNLNSNPTRIEVTEAGRHTINAFVREDGFDLDRIIITSDAAYDPNVDAVPASTLVTPSSVFNVGFAVEEDATDAQFSVDGTTITRANNAVDDVIDGITFNLLQETDAGEELTVNVNADTELARSAIINFVDSYNELRIFAAEQALTDDDGAPVEDAVLASSSTLRAVLNRVNNEVAAIVDGVGAGNFDRLADIGLDFSDFEGDEETPFVRNILVVDEAQLDSALAANFDQVRDIFEFDFTSDDPNLAVFTRTNGLGVTDVSLNINQSGSTYEATYTNPSTGLSETVALDAEPAAGGVGVLLSGQSGTLLDGLVLIYASNDNAVASLSLTQGIGDRVYNALENVLEDGGLLDTELDAIVDSNRRLQDEIDRIDEQVERFRDQLILRYSALETAISQADIILQSLAAQADARNQ